MDVRIEPGKYWGKVNLPPSRQEMHRKIIIGTLAGAGRIDGSDDCDDTKSSFDASYGLVRTYPDGKEPEVRKLRCGASLAAVKMIMPVSGLFDKKFLFDVKDELKGLDLKALTDVLCAHGMSFEGSSLPFVSSGKLQPGKYEIDLTDADFISGLLMALPMLGGDSELKLLNEPANRAAIEITIKALKDFEIEVGGTFGDWIIKGGQKAVLPEPPKKAYEYVNPNYKHKFKKHQNPTSPGLGIKCERDWSIAANYIVANYFGSDVAMDGLSDESLQREKCIGKALEGLGGKVDVSEIPSLIPLLAVAACKLNGTTELTGCGAFADGEKSRVVLTVDMINALGGDAKYDGAADGGTIIIKGTGSLKGGKVDPKGDHRVAMAASIAAHISEKGIDVLGASCTSKSCLNFFMDGTWLGAKMYYNV
jgi:3-phosphoshikimate 1-carboxyvinyltransferase